MESQQDMDVQCLNVAFALLRAELPFSALAIVECSL